MTDQDAQFSSNPVLSCDVCGKSFSTQGGLTRHKNNSGIHEGLRRNEKNEIEFLCNVCGKVFMYRSTLNAHQCNKHRATTNVSAESIEEKTETTATTKVEDPYEGDGHESDGNEISYEKECVVEISTSMALGNI